MIRNPLAGACLVVLALAACSPQQSATPAAAEPATETVAPATAADATLDAAIAGAWRDPANAARDPYRHPGETLAFFGIRPDMTVVEITPGGGWYADILAPYLRTRGKYVAAVWDDAIAGQPQYRYNLNKTLRDKFNGNPAVYGTPEVRVFDPAAPVFGPAASADTVLTFRNAHNWVSDGNADAYFKAFFDVLKPGGTLGVVDHRAAAGTDFEKIKDSGYIPEEMIVKFATDAGFRLADKSEINANPKDTKDYEKGVWTLPPTLALGEVDRDKYLAIGEADNFLLKFRKPKK